MTVADSGIGIAKTIKNKIFDPFFTTKDVGRGTSLGLSVTYGIIQKHGGVITVKSPVARRKTEQMAPATAFHIRLPAADNHQPKNREDQEYGGNSRA